MRVSLDHLTWGSSDALFIYEENLDGFFCLGVSKSYSDSFSSGCNFAKMASSL